MQKKNDEPLPVNKYVLSNKTEDLKYAMDFLSASLIVMGKDSNPSIELFNSPKFQTNFERVYIDDKYAVYKNINAYPRFGLFYEYHLVDNDQESLNLLSNKQDLSKKIIIEEGLPVVLKVGTGSAELLSSSLNSQVFKVDTDTPALFYISDTYYPGWKAEINNKESKIYRANYNLRAVLVPEGESEIKFSYIPSNFTLASSLTVASFTGLVLILFLHNKLYALVWRSKIYE